MSEKPRPIPVDFAGVPSKLRERPQWILWQYAQRDGKWTKQPLSLDGKRPVDPTSPASWNSFEEVQEAHGAQGIGDGIGFCFSADDPFVGIDLDDCCDGEQLQDWTAKQRQALPEGFPEPREIAAQLATYTEASPSGTGAKLFCRGVLPGTGRHVGDFEIYDRGRYFAVTGRRLGQPGVAESGEYVEQLYNLLPQKTDTGESRLDWSVVEHPDGVSDDEIVEQARQDGRVRDLWHGEWAQSHQSQSEADMALASHLAYFAGPYPAIIDRLFRKSELMREKWDSGRGDTTYGRMTVEKAVAGKDDFFNWRLTAMTVSSHTSQSSHSSHNFYSNELALPVVEEAAFYGPLGEIALGLREHTEASPIAIHCSALAYLGNALGRRFYVQLDQRHYPKLYVALVGPTSSGRKGTADVERKIVDAVDSDFGDYRHGGLTTGEGLLQVLADFSDEGNPRPAMFAEREFGAVLRRSERKGNTLSMYIRDAWDNELLASSTRQNPLRVEHHHVGICAHITPSELKRLLSDADVANGFSNRFLWLHTQRQGLKPGVKGFIESNFSEPITRLRESVNNLLQHAEAGGRQLEIPLADDATRLWYESLYAELDVDADEDTNLTLICGRQPQQVCRLALVLALADGAQVIEVQHFEAACAIARYAYDSVDYILSRDWAGEPGYAGHLAGMETKVVDALRRKREMTRTEISVNVFSKHRTAKEINLLRDRLAKEEKIEVVRRDRTEIWRLAS